jgi:hypothetical protein
MTTLSGQATSPVEQRGSAPWRIEESQLGLLNTVLQRADDVLVYNCVTRTAQESKLFPVMPYLMTVMIEAYYRFPDLIREASRELSPEAVGHRSREVTTYLSGLTGWAVLNYYLNGRSLLIRLGLVRPEDNLEDLWTMVDWWLRFKQTYHRNSGHVWAHDAWDMQPSHPERVLQVLEADAYACDERLRRATVKFAATTTQYSFLACCESRSGLQASGPYRLGGSRLLHTRDFMNLAEGDFSWLDDVAGDVPHNNLTLALITSGLRVEVADWGTPYTTPEDYGSRLIGVGLYTSDFLADRYIPVGMGSAAELTDTLEHLTEVFNQATRKLYRRYTEMSARQMIEAGVYTYLSAANGISHAAGTYHQSQWEFVDDRVRRLWPLYNEEYSLDAYLDNFATLQGLQGSANEYYMDPVPYRSWRGSDDELPGPGRNAFPVSSHVLSDDDYSRRVNPNGLADCRGTSSLPAKTALFATTRGRLTEDELNATARSLRSPLYEAPWVHFDEQWVKWHWQDPEVDRMYRYGQERSRLIAGQGSAMRRADISRLRDDAGEPRWEDMR